MIKKVFNEAFEAVREEIFLQFSASQKFDGARIFAVNKAGDKCQIATIQRAGKCYFNFDERPEGIITRFGGTAKMEIDFLPYIEIASISAELTSKNQGY